MSSGKHWAATEWWSAVSQARMLAEQEATFYAARRLVLANALCSELIETEGRYSEPIIGVALGLLKRLEDGGLRRPALSRTNLAYIPQDARAYVAAEPAAARVAAAVAMLHTADYAAEYERDAHHVTECLRAWLTSRTVVLPPEERVIGENLVRGNGNVALSRVQQVANRYAEGGASVDDVLAAIAAAHDAYAQSRAAAPSDGTGTVAELDSWYGIVARADDLSADLFYGLPQLMRAYGPFASDRGWVVQPTPGHGSNRDPDNPFYRPDPAADYMPYEIAGVLYGVGLDTVDALLRSMTNLWDGSIKAEGSTDNGGGTESTADSTTPDRTIYTHLMSPYFIGGLLAEGKLALDMVEDFGERFTPLVTDSSAPWVGVPIGFASDMDGGRHAMVAGSKAGMEGWKLRTTTRGGDLVSEFEKAAVRDADDVRYVQRIPANTWTAWSHWDFTLTSLITPDGGELLLPMREARQT